MINNIILILILISLITITVFLVLILKAIKNIKIENINVKEVGSKRALNNKVKKSFIVPEPTLDSLIVNNTEEDIPLTKFFNK